VEVSEWTKGAPITVDDVLFASRALMPDPQQTIADGFDVLSADRWRLVLGTSLDENAGSIGALNRS
jgi:hypothetical protein